MKYASWLLLAAVLSIPCRADDLTDAMLGVDPRPGLSSGAGVVYDQAYGPEDASSAEVPEGLEEELVPSGWRYEGLDIGDSLGPLYGGDEAGDATLTVPDLSTTVEPIPLGKPEEREGVWYEDDVGRGR